MMVTVNRYMEYMNMKRKQYTLLLKAAEYYGFNAKTNDAQNDIKFQAFIDGTKVQASVFCLSYVQSAYQAYENGFIKRSSKGVK